MKHLENIDKIIEKKFEKRIDSELFAEFRKEVTDEYE